MKRNEVRAQIESIGILPSIRVTSRDLAQYAAETVYAAGIPIAEITLTVPGGANEADLSVGPAGSELLSTSSLDIPKGTFPKLNVWTIPG